jgi:hypothetical protein
MSAPIRVEGLSNVETPNPYNYTEEQKQQKELAVRTMHELYPNVPIMYCDWVYDLCTNSTQEEIEKMKNRIDTIPSRRES